jgi:hypothetical protein
MEQEFFLSELYYSSIEEMKHLFSWDNKIFFTFFFFKLLFHNLF